MQTRPLARTATCLSALLFAGLISPLLAQSRLIYPRLSFENGTITGLAIVNPSNDEAVVTFTAYRSDGEFLQAEGFENPVMRTVRAGEQLSEVAATLFGSGLQDPAPGWIEAQSEVSDLTGFFLVLDGQVSFFDGADLPETSREILFQDIRLEEGFSTELNIVNPSSTSTVSVALVMVSETERLTHQIEIAARGVARVDVAELFSQPLSTAGDISRPSYIVASAPAPVAGFALVRGPGDALGLNAVPASEQLNRLYFPQLAVLDPFITEITLVNTASETALVTITAHQPNGDLYAAQDLTTNPVVRSLDPGGILKTDAETLFGFFGDETLEGWLEVESTSQAIQGSISYSITASNSIAAVSSTAHGNRNAVFSHIATTLGFFTGIAMLNTGTLAANVRVVAVEPDGSVIGTFSTTLRPGVRISDLITEMIPATEGRGGGLVSITSDTPIYLTSLFGSLQSGVLANIPPQTVPETYGPDVGPAISINPPLAILSPAGNQRFSLQGASQPMNWSVDGEPGGSAVTGSIDAQGNFVAPAVVPMALPVTITAEADNQVSGASVDVIARRSLIGGLGIVQSVAYLEGLDRLFSAELLLGPAATAGNASPSQNEMSLISDVTEGTADAVIELEDDVSKMVAFTGVDGVEYLLLAGRTSGTIRRLNPQTMEAVTIAADLNAPSAMVIDPFSGALLIAESNGVISLAEGILNEGLLATSQGSGTDHRSFPVGTVNEISPRGIAVDSCNGNILISDADGQSIVSIDRATNQVVTLFSELSGPGQLLGLSRQGVPCPSAFHLFIVAETAGQVLLGIPATGMLALWAEVPGVRDLAFVPAASAIDNSEGITSGSDSGEVLFSAVPDLYETDSANPTTSQGASLCLGEVSFADGNLDAAVREALDLQPSETITCAAAATVSALNVQNVGVSDLSGVEALTGLTDLRLDDNQIADISAVARLTGLTRLDLDNNQIADISPIRDLTSLTRLDLEGNQVTDVSAIAGLTQLTNLDLDRNQVSDIAVVSRFTQLVSLAVESNQLTDISAVSDLTRLDILDLADNQITDLTPLTRLTVVRFLLLGDNQVSDISALAGLTQLISLNLTRNQISDVSVVSGFTNLSTLFIRDNQVSDISALVLNPGLGNGDSINISMNVLGADDCANIQTLIDRGASVVHDVSCP